MREKSTPLVTGIVAEADRLSRLVGGLLSLSASRADPDAVHLEPLDLDGRADDAELRHAVGQEDAVPGPEVVDQPGVGRADTGRVAGARLPTEREARPVDRSLLEPRPSQVRRGPPGHVSRGRPVPDA